MIDVRKLGMLEALDRLGSVAAVADELRLTAPGVSMQLSGLERELKMALTERQGRRLVLTPAGRRLASQSREVLDRLALVGLEVDAIREGSTGAYRVVAFPSAARTFVADVWRRLLVDGATIDLTLSTPEPEEALSALSAGHADLAVIHSYSNVPRNLPDGVDSELLADEPVWVALRADDPAAASAVAIETLADRSWITPPPEVTCFDMVERACAVGGFKPRVVAQSLDFSAQLQLVAAGVGVALVPALTVQTVPDGVRLVATTSRIVRHLHAARRAALRGDAGLRRLVDELGSAARARIDASPRP
jgi:DNA-binding transcriptional LysR family regulator